MSRIAVAISGGVDSAVAALELLERGSEVIGVHMKLGCFEGAAEAAGAARSVCEKLGVEFVEIELEKEFEKEVMRPFAEEYLAGRTPNPCVTCNRRIKFGELFERAGELGAEFLATGHYVVKERRDGRWALLRGKDRRKDQSYFLYSLTQEVLERAEFPNGEHTKREVRRKAEEAALPVKDRPESLEICFTEPGAHGDFIQGFYPGKVRPGPIVDTKGNVIGEHRGIVYYTVGQRRGMGVSAPDPLYVIEVRAEDNIVVAGVEEELFSDGVLLRNENWVAGEPPSEGEEVEIKIRYNAAPAPAVYAGRSEEGALARFKKPLRAVTPGQAAVLYRGEEVLGGGTIIGPAREMDAGK